MIKVVTAQEMQDIDARTIRKFGLAGILLMERAGLAVAAEIQARCSSFGVRKVCILCGGGNNGGDGLVVARQLHNEGISVEAYISTAPSRLTADALVNYHAARKFGVEMYPLSSFSSRCKKGERIIIVDALLGTGLTRSVRSPFSSIINKVNTLNCPVISVDIPSGIASDTGQIMGCAVRAQQTVTFGLPKRGHLLHPGAELSGELTVVDIGFPRALVASSAIYVNLIEKEDVSTVLPSRPVHSHKGTYGHVLLIGGSKGKTGAALMAARACLRAGAGLVTLGIPDSLVKVFQSRVTEEMVLPLPDTGQGTVSAHAADAIQHFLQKKGTVLAVGPGLSVTSDTEKLVRVLAERTDVPLVLDADALNAIAGYASRLKKRKVPAVLTPHLGEMFRLLKKNTASGQRAVAEKDSVEQDRIGTACAFARRTGTCLVLKGAPTITALPDGSAWINATGNPGMASAGTGDVLTGIAAAFLAQGMPPQDASVAAVYVHGLAGDNVSGRKGQHSLIASDLIRALPGALKSLISPH